MILRRYLFIIFPSLFFIFVCNNSHASEVIQHFASDITIASDSSLNLTETITVNAQGIDIKRGIYRDFPTQYKDIYGNRYNVQFELVSVLRNGEAEDYHTEAIRNGIRVYIGNKNRFLKHGTHTFTLEYYTNRQLGFYSEFDELYWNVTGNDWAFPIQEVSATVHLPPGVSIDEIDTEAFTGATGDKGKHFIVSTDDGSILFETIRQLPPKHGLTIVVNWPKGFVQEPTQEEKLTWFFQDNQATLVGLTGLAILWLYLYFAWLKVGKDPHKAAIYPRYEPDKQHSPASMRFVQRMGYDNKTFSAALVNMAVKGYVSITEDQHFTLKKTGQTARLSLGESAISRTLFSRGDQITLKQSEHDRIGKAIKAHKKVLKRDYEKIFFLTNKMALLPGWLISLAVLISTILSISSSEAQSAVAFFTLWLSIWSIGVIFLLFSVFNAWKNVQGILTLFPALFITAFSVPFVAGEGFGLYMMWQNSGTGVLAIFVLVIVTNILFYKWMKAPTLKGRELLDKVDGFKLFLSVTGSEALKYSKQPELTPALFEQYLPYAMALDVENQWSERFDSTFSQLQQQGNHHSPRWYHGHNWNSNTLTGFSSTMGSSLSSAIASSSTAPGSSSGSSGGSSGGGGGGGGGGGW